MIYDIPLMRSMDPHHARLGYLGVCAVVGVRSLDTYDALVARMRDVLFARMYDDEAVFHAAVAAADPLYSKELQDRTTRSDEEDPAAILAPHDARVRWLTRSEAWLYDQRMPSHVGYLQSDHVGRTVDLARWTGVLLPTLELSEDGMLLSHLVSGGRDEAWRDSNLLYVANRPATVLLYLRLLLRAEILFPSLLLELVERQDAGQVVAARGSKGLLRAAVARLQRRIGEPKEPEDILAVRELDAFSTSIHRSLSTEENYLRPRLEMLVDLGLLERPSGDGGARNDAFPWRASERGRAVARKWITLEATPQSVDAFLQNDFVDACSPLLTGPVRPVKNDDEALLWFARASAQVQRDIGFTPGRTIAMLASLMAAEQGVRLEVADMFRTVYAIPKGEYASFVRFSGGSRFDSEFMIRVDPALLSHFEARFPTVTE